MPATCYRCTALGHADPGEPFGSCQVCRSFACHTCGNRVPKISRFYCVICEPALILMPSGGLPPGGGGRPPGGGGGPPGGPGDTVPPYASTEEFEALEPELAKATAEHRAWCRDHLDDLLEVSAGYGFNEAQREYTDRAVGYERYDDAAERALRADFLRGAQRLARDVQAAQARNRLRKNLVADAFGVAQWAIGARPGEQVSPERVAMLPDARLRFVVGLASVAAGGVVAKA